MSNPFRRNVISIYRFPQDVAIVSTSWQRLDFDNATLLIAGLSADIQQKNTLGRIPANLPGDVNNGENWEIFFNGIQNAYRDRDFIKDEQNRTFQITSAYWTVFQYQCRCELLQT